MLCTAHLQSVAAPGTIRKVCPAAHWLRHTAGSHMTDQQVDLRFVRDNFGHSSLSTTSGYLHSEEDARHQATQERHRIGWGSKR